MIFFLRKSMTRKIILGELAWNSPQGVTSSTSANLCEVSSGSFLLQVLTEAAESSHLFLCYSWRCEITHFSLHSKLNPAAGVKPFMVSHPWIQFFDTRCLSQLHTAVLSVIWTHIGLVHNGCRWSWCLLHWCESRCVWVPTIDAIRHMSLSQASCPILWLHSAY